MITVHYKTFDDVLKHIEQLATDLRVRADSADQRRKEGFDHRLIDIRRDRAEASGLHLAAQIMRDAKIDTETNKMKYIDIVFEDTSIESEPPVLVFVEVENAQGVSVGVGRWVEREDGYTVLRICEDVVNSMTK